MPSQKEWLALACICPVIFTALVGMVMLLDTEGKARPFVLIAGTLAFAALMSSAVLALIRRPIYYIAAIFVALAVMLGAAVGSWIITLY
jgi:hypothetical protein